MSDHFPQFSEKAPRRQFRPKFFLQIDALEDGAALQAPDTDGTDTPPQQKGIGNTPLYQNLPEDRSTPPPFFPQYKSRARFLTLPSLKQGREGEEKWLAARSRLWEPGSFRFDVADDGFEVEKLATIPVPAWREGIPDLRGWPDIQDADDSGAGFDRQDTIPMTVLKGIAELQGQSAPVMQSEITGAASNAACNGLGNILGNIFKSVSYNHLTLPMSHYV